MFITLYLYKGILLEKVGAIGYNPISEITSIVVIILFQLVLCITILITAS